MKNKILWILFLILLFISSYYREVLFRSINAIIDGEQFFYAKTTRLEYLDGWTKAELFRLKYILTISFSFLFIALSTLGLKLSFKIITPLYLSIASYLLIILAVLVIGIYALTISSFSEVYPTLRLLVGWVHNPLIYLLISIGTIGYQSMNTINDQT